MSRDFAVAAWTRALALTAPIPRAPEATLSTRIDELADRFGDATALVDEARSLTYREAAGLAHQFGRWALGQGLRKGDVVCLVMHNCAAYMPIWLGITRTGAIVSLVNTSLVGDSLAHAIRVASPRHVIAGAGLTEAVQAVRRGVDPAVQWWSYGESRDGFAPIDDVVDRLPQDPLDADECARPTIADAALYVYTSGTTGLPKAAIVTHRRALQWSCWFAGLLDTSAADRMYDCLPMFHSVGGVVATGSVLMGGGSVVIRQRFSARRFWDDVVGERCTLFQYIGELCRFLLQSPSHPLERQHSLRIACGNGLRADVWGAFEERFAIPRIVEFYAATEANFSLYNCEGKRGSIGRIPPFLPQRTGIELVSLDAESGEPVRGEHGLCVRCAAGEVGEAIARVRDDARFEGYTDAAASERKLLRDVFVAGDAWFRSGDLMRRDDAGFFYFVDRTGDTFRWKGENVSTTEVSETLMLMPGIVDATVYGVSVAGADGRAGMAALVTDERFSMDALATWLEGRVPEFARPVFVRLLAGIETTSTFKPVKRDLARAGFDPAATSDAIYVRERDGAYTRMNAALVERIRAGSIRL